MRDEVFEALCEVCGIDWQGAITNDERGRVNVARKELVSLYGEEATFVLPGMIRERAEAWAKVYPEIALTPQALTGNWSSIMGKAEALAQRVAEKKPKEMGTNRYARNNCQTCGDDHFIVTGQDEHGHELTAPCPDCNTAVRL